MESAFKNRLDAKQINSLTQHAFGQLPDGFYENTIGEFSALYMVKLENKEIVLKIAPKDNIRVLRYEKKAMQAEVAALKLLKAANHVPVPDVFFYDTTKTLCESEYFFMEKINGTNLNSLLPKMDAEEKSRFMNKIGQMNRQLNEIDGERFGYPAQSDNQTDNWKSAFWKIISDILDDGKDAEIKLPIPYDEIENIIHSFIFACDDVKNPKLIHWDLWSGNVLVHNDKVTGIIDFERVLWADPLMEYYFRKHAFNEDFFAGYGLDISSLDRNSKIRLALYDLYLALIWVIEYHYRNYNDLEGYSWRKEQLVQSIKFLNSF
ncbi:MAG: aminoglycoside phosphotransferase family protein [Oscillospiraceae bacterium]|nr:aminoglycoside phosphotransferase family protein [Oscillospiraceae bacterium]